MSTGTRQSSDLSNSLTEIVGTVCSLSTARRAPCRTAPPPRRNERNSPASQSQVSNGTTWRFGHFQRKGTKSPKLCQREGSLGSASRPHDTRLGPADSSTVGIRLWQDHGPVAAGTGSSG